MSGDDEPSMNEPPHVLIAVTDLMFQSRVREQAIALGMGASAVDSMEAAATGLGSSPSLLVIDLQGEAMNATELISSAKERGVPVLAFGRHTEAEALRAAREAGADAVVVRSTLVEELPDLLTQHARSGT